MENDGVCWRMMVFGWRMIVFGDICCVCVRGWVFRNPPIKAPLGKVSICVWKMCLEDVRFLFLSSGLRKDFLLVCTVCSVTARSATHTLDLPSGDEAHHVLATHRPEQGVRGVSLFASLVRRGSTHAIDVFLSKADRLATATSLQRR